MQRPPRRSLAAEKLQEPGAGFVVTGGRPPSATLQDKSQRVSSSGFRPARPLSGSPPKERQRIALDIILGHPAWDEKSSASSPASPNRIQSKAVENRPRAHSKDQDGAGAIKAFDTRIAQSNESTAPQEDVSREKSPDLNTDDDTIPATMSRQIGSIALQNASAATPISATAVQTNGDDEGRKDDGDGRRVVNGAGGGSVGSSKGGGGRVRAKGSESDGFSAPLGSVGSDDDRFFFSEEDDRYDAIELLDTYEDEDEDRAVEAFELAASAAVKSRNLKHAGGNTFERSRFETVEPLLMQGVQGKEVRRPASSLGISAPPHHHATAVPGVLTRPHSSAAVRGRAGERPRSALQELREIKRRSRGVSPQVGQILAQARATRGRPSVEMANAVRKTHLEENEPHEIAGHIGPDRRRSRERSAGGRPPSGLVPAEHKTRESAAGGSGAEGRRGGNASDVHSVQRRLALLSPLVSASAPMSDISFGKAGWKTKAAGGGVMQQDAKAGGTGRHAGSATAPTPASALARDKSMAKDAVLGIPLHLAPEVEKAIDALPPGGGSLPLANKFNIRRAASAGNAREGEDGDKAGGAMVSRVRETFVSVDTCSVLEAAVQDGYPVPPNHKVVEMVHRPTQLHEIYLVPQRKPASREDAAEAHRWLQDEWKKFLDRSGRSREGARTAVVGGEEGREKGKGVEAPNGGKSAGGKENYPVGAEAQVLDDVTFVCKGNELLSLGFHEVLRQVYMQCSERGRALEYVWRLHLGLTDLAFEYAKQKGEDLTRLQSQSLFYKSEQDREHDVGQRVKTKLAAERAQYEAYMARAQAHEAELVYRFVGMEQMIERLTIKYEKSKRLCRNLAAKATVMRDMLNDAQEACTCFLKDGQGGEKEVGLSFHSSWGHRPEKELKRQEAYLRGVKEQPQEILESVSIDKMSAWETMHDKMFDLVFESEQKRLGHDAEIEMYKRSLAQAIDEKEALNEDLARTKTLTLLAYGGATMATTGVQCSLLHGANDVSLEDDDDSPEIEEPPPPIAATDEDDLRRLFHKMDVDHSGSLSMDEFVSAMSRMKMGILVPPEPAAVSQGDDQEDKRPRAPKTGEVRQAGKVQEKVGIMRFVKEKHKGPIMPLGKLLSVIDEMYAEKIKADEIDDREENVRAAPEEYFYDFLLTKFGLKSLADKKVAEIAAAVSHWSKTCLVVKHFGQFHGVCNNNDYLGPLDSNTYGDPCGVLNVYLEVLKRLKAGKQSRKISDRDPMSGLQLVSRSRLQKEIPGIIAAYGNWNVAHQFLFPSTLGEDEPEFKTHQEHRIPNVPPEQQRKKHVSHGPDTSPDVDLDLVLEKAIEIGKIQEAHVFDGMLARFKEADVDGDGVMTFEEFQTFVASLAHVKVKPKKLKSLFLEMVEESSGSGAEDSISPLVFVRHAITNNLIDPGLRFQTNDKQKDSPLPRAKPDAANHFKSVKAKMTALSSMRTLMSKAAAEGSPTSPADATGGDKTGTGNSVETLVSERSNHQNDAEKLGTGADGGQSEEDTKDKVFLTNLQPRI